MGRGLSNEVVLLLFQAPLEASIDDLINPLLVLKPSLLHSQGIYIGKRSMSPISRMNNNSQHS